MPRHFVALCLFLLAAPAAFAQTVTEISPRRGPESGRTPVVITGTGLSLPPNFACIVPCPTTVRFGDSAAYEVAASEETDTRILVLSPAHPAGAVNVTVRTGDGRSVTVPNAFTYETDFEAGYEKVLLPVYVDGNIAGQNGSIWRTELWFRNHGPAINLAPWTCEAQVCPPVFPMTKSVQPGESFKNLPYIERLASNPGRLLYVTRNANYSVNVRFSDVSRHELNAGTEMPTVRESELHNSTAHLLNVPVDAHSRLLLRIYDVDHEQARFRVRVWPQEGTAVAPYVDTEVVARTGETGSFRNSPAYVQHTQFLDPAAIVNLPTSVRVEVTPLTPGSRFWAFVSVTNNNTQLVSLVTPQ